MYQYKLVHNCLESNFPETDCRVIIDNNLNMSQKCALAAKLTNSHQSCSKESFGSSPKELILPLYSDVVRFLQC